MGKKDKKNKEKKEKIKLKKEKQKLKSLKTKKKKKQTLSDEDFDSICLYYENLNKKDKYGHININNTSNNTFVECEKPSPRSNCSITFINEEEFILFGGEYNDNNELIVYNDLFKYNVVKNKWKYYFTTCKKPKPRCSHQSVYFNKKLYIFGGELCTNTQFFHFNDFWCFDLKNNIFEEIETKNKKDEKPSPRSGHRMILWKNCLVMFGGFFDNGKSVEYFNDLYIYIINCNKWINLTNIHIDYLFKRLTENNSSNNNNNDDSLSVKSEKKTNDKNYQMIKAKFLKNFDLDSHMPSKRSSVCLFTDTKFQKIYIYGGYSQVKNTSRNSIGAYYNDLWVLNINYINEDNISVKYKKLKKSIFQPSKRIGFSTCTYKNFLILFGGVFDKFEHNNEKNSNTKEESLNMESIFFNDIYLFDMNKEHWSYLSLKNKETKNLNINSKENKKNESEENKSHEININKHSSSEKESSFSENKIVKSEYKDHSENYDSNYLNDDDNEEYYSNVFVYFDENGNKKTMKIEKDEISNMNFNEKKEYVDSVENEMDKQMIKENNIVMDNIVDSHSVFIEEKEPKCSNENSNIKDLSDVNGLKYVNNSKEPESSKDLDEFFNISYSKSVNEKIKDEYNNEIINDLSNSDLESNKSYKKKKIVINDIEPIGRINSHIFIINKNLYLYGGMYEYKNNEIMLNDYWKINIFKREKWELIDKGNLDDIYVEESDLSSSLSIDDENKDEKEIEDIIICSKIKKIENIIKVEDSGLGFDANENLNEFFLRTKDHWLKQLNIINETKQSRKDAFILCEKKYVLLKKYYNKIQKYKELLYAEEYEKNMIEDNISEEETSD
ncbi:kelch protein, putative [Plasmodium gallinaceum]|uniref:Kelch protein, putative n=1 Tax=Plasmodium gallinaceum TaxID=5849 RepID=A0A1J1GYA2_PLAGA|nr:kelch protein, putative [Plasmodium gallinaceum]CRG97240.1 kelch protein, putative [Plasmodium gallinaceum]